jgi:hypothetical protein
MWLALASVMYAQQQEPPDQPTIEAQVPSLERFNKKWQERSQAVHDALTALAEQPPGPDRTTAVHALGVSLLESGAAHARSMVRKEINEKKIREDDPRLVKVLARLNLIEAISTNWNVAAIKLKGDIPAGRVKIDPMPGDAAAVTLAADAGPTEFVKAYLTALRQTPDQMGFKRGGPHEGVFGMVMSTPPASSDRTALGKVHNDQSWARHNDLKPVAEKIDGDFAAVIYQDPYKPESKRGVYLQRIDGSWMVYPTTDTPASASAQERENSERSQPTRSKGRGRGRGTRTRAKRASAPNESQAVGRPDGSQDPMNL